MTSKITLTALKLCFIGLLLTSSESLAQIGIGTTSPSPSSILDVSSTTQGFLTPRMTTAQRTAITSPADGLMVYDTDLRSFYYYSLPAASWTMINSGGTPRVNFKRIRSGDNLAVVLASELTAGGGAKYMLASNTLYEINGQITFNLPVDLNNAYLSGLDANDDIIVKTSGFLFSGSTGGSIRNLTITTPGATVFNLTGSATQTLLVRDCIIANSSSIGTISGYGLTFFSIVNYSGNTNGITYNNIGQLLLSNQAWFSNNSGTYEKFTGTFNLIQKQGGFSNVAATAIGLDVSASNLSITSDAVLESVVFTGPVPAGFVQPYTAGSYPGYNFNNSWNVRSAGIPTESDANAAGDFAMDYPVGNGLSVGFNTSNPSNIVKIGSGTPPTVYSNLFRFTTDDVNRLRYAGKKKRIFQISGAISFQVPAAGTYIVFIAKNGTPISQYKIYGRGAATNDIVVLPLNASAEMVTNDYIEVFVQRFSGSTGNIIVPNMTLTIR
ncbi:hypothetical protein [Flavobacterium ginsengiterrae]|jgi:hypothetical protein|uniref:C1q domain-containing protein n=1 Tax=Flavobacterium ginsengiterrae TaxID=871695 RepID=A0ABP7G3L9_9FLAO